MARYNTKQKLKQKPKKSLLPLWLALVSLGLVLVVGWAVWSSNSQVKANIEVKGAPRLKVEKDTIDHGDNKLGNQIRDDIRVTNVGDQPLRSPKHRLLKSRRGVDPPHRLSVRWPSNPVKARSFRWNI